MLNFFLTNFVDMLFLGCALKISGEMTGVILLMSNKEFLRRVETTKKQLLIIGKSVLKFLGHIIKEIRLREFNTYKAY